MGTLRRAWPYALISGGTGLVTFLLLPPQSLPGKYLQGDESDGIGYAVRGAVVAAAAIAGVLVVWPRRSGEREWRHLAVPPVLAVLVPLTLVLVGGGRSRLWTGLLCAAVAVATHVVMALPRRWIRVPAWALVATAGVLISIGCQSTWRAEDFEATGLPYYVADIPGFHLRATYADEAQITLTYFADDDRLVWLNATISRECPANCIDLPGGAQLGYGRPERAGSGVTLPPPAGVTVRPVTAKQLASYRTGVSPLAD